MVLFYFKSGDSAGGNLSACVALKCIEMGFRIPDSLFLAYFPCAIAWSPTPARFLSLIDPLIPLGFMTNCLKGNYKIVILSLGFILLYLFSCVIFSLCLFSWHLSR